ncbi:MULTISPECIES: GLPGLI family protein [Chryseobacterium]|uniref:GLPGLI family protein n=1 Tax=Chryseobacterium camelliae TaxID=1265445 RepID=A0ABU0TI01_9FLAO|nr:MULTISPECIES: GLPGLI family protein [Chryseobacterium]MDT3409451.1 GLPGLI family protein [Pseudacidovorax intermedius]MDQ1096684.1 GLPGLI family protein [Chryseobacterium camelliae]MDQ1100628.1 GLPGLI family protein [Chryseobacterium sp. SORGH_AS_1048]MDR6087966.1 GLPGLI family protein [Chryseobacterium sp. SORGH_AS_0909]MDR6132340.1 GLPGLI family protein [Chryseobacterium sp. SORGH_AS_1175]
MIRKTLFTFIVLIPLFFCSQKYSFTYEYTFRPDSLHLDKTEIELMGLFVDKNESTYISLRKTKRDSAVASNNESDIASANRSVSTNTFPKEKVRGIIQKNRQSDEVVTYQTLGGERFKIIQHISYNWHIQAETNEIQGKKCQLATMEYRGRTYNAWFTEEIPIAEGPYKFGGLPGLIVKIEDTKKQHVWELKGIEKFRSIKFRLSKFIPVTEMQYKKAVENYLRDPLVKLKDLMQRNGVTSITTTLPDGSSYSDAEYEKMRTRKIQDEYKENNNAVELN